MRKFTTQDVDFNDLRSTLVNSGFAKENNSLFQVINRMIDGASLLKKNLAEKIGVTDKISLTEQVDGLLPPKNGGTKTNLYTPFVTLINNLGGVGVDDLYYYQSGDLVTVFGRFQVLPSSIGINTEFGFTLPTISYFKFPYQCAGAAYSPTKNQGAAIIGDVGNNRAKMQFLSVDNSVFDLYFTFGYKIIEKS